MRDAAHAYIVADSPGPNPARRGTCGPAKEMDEGTDKEENKEEDEEEDEEEDKEGDEEEDEGAGPQRSPGIRG